MRNIYIWPQLAIACYYVVWIYFIALEWKHWSIPFQYVTAHMSVHSNKMTFITKAIRWEQQHTHSDCIYDNRKTNKLIHNENNDNLLPR